MKPTKPLFWHQGLFLQPQHFQQHDIHSRSQLGHLQQYGAPWFWGVVRITFDDQLLNEGILSFTDGEFVFPDATWVSVPDNAIVLSRRFDKVKFEPHKPFVIYAAIRHLSLTNANVTRTQTPEQQMQSGARYMVDSVNEETSDIHDDGEPGQVQRLNHIIKLFIDSEIESLGDYTLLPIARLEYNGEKFIRYPEYAPPAITLGSSTTLMRTARGITDQMLSAARQLEQYKVPRENIKGQNDSSYFVYMLGLMILNRYVPQLYHQLSSPACHPFDFYGLLRQVLGELSSFTDRFGCLADLPDGTRLLPEYDHADSARCYERAAEIIGSLLRLLMTGPDNTIVLNKDNDGGYSAVIPLSAYENVANFYLLVRTAEKSERILIALRDIVKVGSRESVAQLVAYSIPGLPLEYIQVPPPGIPRRADTHCFRLEMNHEQWMEIQKSRTICIYWDNAPSDIAVELVVIRS